MTNKSIVAVFLKDEDRALKLAAELSGDGIEPLLSQTAEEFQRVLNFQRVDLVVIDHDQPGFQTGLEILERLSKDLLRPPTILLGNLNAEMRARAAGLGVETFMSSGATSDALKTAVTSALATAGRSLAAIPPKARKLVLQSDVIQPLPRVLVKVCSYLDDETASIEDLSNDISVDPKLTAELLKITNSTAFGLRNKVTKAADAVKFLGIRQTVSLVMTASVIKMQAGLVKALPDTIRRWYYQRSVLIASTASAFAKNLEDVSPDTAHILGLMQDLGILVMAHGFGPLYQQLIQRVQEIEQLRLEVTEKQEFEISHADVSAALLMKWDLPPSLVSIVANHHEREVPAACSKTEERFIHVMRIGEAVANLADKFSPQRHQRLTALLSSYGAGMTERCKESLAAGVAKAVQASQLFSVSVPDEAALAVLLEKIQSSSEEPAPADGTEEAGGQPVLEENSSTPVTEGEPARPSRPEILVIEDELSILEMITEIVHSVGLEVLSCSDRAQAKELAPRAAAILCDFHLPNEKGSDLVRELRLSQFTGPVIIVSGDRTRGTIADCINAGMTDFLPKPFSATLLLEKLSKHLGKALAANLTEPQP